MAETPLLKLVRVLGGVALGNGSLGHQVLGQLLVLNSRELEVAAATVVLAGSSTQPDAVLQATVRVLAPALALHFIARRSEARLLTLQRNVEAKLAELGARQPRRARPKH